MNWITNTSAVLSIVYGISGYLLDQHDLTTAMLFISGSGIGAGIGRKVDKNTEAVKQATIVDISLAKTS